MDAYFTEDGDIAVSTEGDIAITQTQWRDDLQQAYIRMMTDIGDFVLYPELGASLSFLYGMPQSNVTGDYGVKLIESALQRENRFVGRQTTIKAIPISHQSIRFDVFIESGSREQMRISVEQDLEF